MRSTTIRCRQPASAIAELDEGYANELQEIYSDIEQHIPNQIEEKKKGGYVFLKSIDEKKRDDFIQASLVELKNRIITLKKNYQIDDICILVRKNDELTAVSEYLINETNYEIISSGSLTLGSSKLLQIIITCLRYLSSPHDLYLKTIAYLIHKEQIKIGIKLRDAIIKYCKNNDTIFSKVDDRIKIIDNEK